MENSEKQDKSLFFDALAQIGIHKACVEMLKKLHAFLEDCTSKLGLEPKGSVILAYEKTPLKLKRGFTHG